MVYEKNEDILPNYTNTTIDIKNINVNKTLAVNGKLLVKNNIQVNNDIDLLGNINYRNILSNHYQEKFTINSKKSKLLLNNNIIKERFNTGSAQCPVPKPSTSTDSFNIITHREANNLIYKNNSSNNILVLDNSGE